MRQGDSRYTQSEFLTDSLTVANLLKIDINILSSHQVCSLLGLAPLSAFFEGRSSACGGARVKGGRRIEVRLVTIVAELVCCFLYVNLTNYK